MNRQRPQLRNGVDLQLQSAFNDGNWAVAIRLAEKRARTFNDQYYEVVKICAESQLDDPGAKFAAVAAVEKFVRDGTVVKEVDSVDLLEWASLDLMHEEDYAKTLGPLRVRTVKASPKDGASAVRSLESCLLHWDLVSAQQIAAILDRSFPQTTHFMFWNIVITHMLAMSPQAPPEKKSLYSMLSLKQIQRAAQVSEQANAGDATAKPQPQSRSIQSEEEIILLYDIVEKHGTADDFEKLMTSPIFCPVAQLRQGRKEFLLRAVAKHRREHDWAAIFQLCKDCLSIEDENGQPSLLAADWSIWREFIEAAEQTKGTDPETQKTVQEILIKVIKVSNLRPIYKRNILLARLSAAFLVAPHDEDDVSDGQPVSLRLRELISYIHDQSTNAACFDDIKRFVEKLAPAGMKYLAFEHAPRLADETEGQVNSARVRTLALKLQYFVSTCPSMYVYIPGDDRLRRCVVSGQELEADAYSPTFSKVSKDALKLHQSLDDITADHPAVEAEIRPDLALVIAFCSLQQAFPPSTDNSSSPTSLRPLLKALLLLEHQLSLTPKHGAISLVLVQLHLLLGSAPRARDIWETLGVKRTIMDSLGPLFYDRISTIAPGMVSPSDTRGWQLMEVLNSHYAVSLKLRMPRRLIDAFEAGSYGSVLSIPEYHQNLRWSCTRAMSLVEEARTERTLGMQYVEVFQDTRFTEVEDDIELKEVIDHGSFPSWSCTSVPPLHSRLRVGPLLNNRRAHLSLLAEAFHETLSYKPPAGYKAGQAAAASEQLFILETLTQLSNSLAKFIVGPKTDMTTQETDYFGAISLLSTLIPSVTTVNRSGPLPDIFAQIIGAVKMSLDNIRRSIIRGDQAGPESQVKLLSSLHAVGILRDTAAAAKQASIWILAFGDREKDRDRSGKSNLPKDLISMVKDLQSAADAALKEGKGVMEKLKSDVNGRDFDLRARRWIFEVDEEGIQAVLDDKAVKRLVQSWEGNVKGWAHVKWS